MCPEWARLGTVTNIPTLVDRRRAPGEVGVTRAPPDFGKPTTIPACRPLPCISRVPWVATWRGFPLQCGVGVH
jgi:hypothetical protein